MTYDLNPATLDLLDALPTRAPIRPRKITRRDTRRSNGSNR